MHEAIKRTSHKRVDPPETIKKIIHMNPGRHTHNSLFSTNEEYTIQKDTKPVIHKGKQIGHEFNKSSPGAGLSGAQGGQIFGTCLHLLVFLRK